MNVSAPVSKTIVNRNSILPTRTKTRVRTNGTVHMHNKCRNGSLSGVELSQTINDSKHINRLQRTSTLLQLQTSIMLSDHPGHREKLLIYGVKQIRDDLMIVLIMIIGNDG